MNHIFKPKNNFGNFQVFGFMYFDVWRSALFWNFSLLFAANCRILRFLRRIECLCSNYIKICSEAVYMYEHLNANNQLQALPCLLLCITLIKPKDTASLQRMPARRTKRMGRSLLVILMDWAVPSPCKSTNQSAVSFIAIVIFKLLILKSKKHDQLSKLRYHELRHHDAPTYGLYLYINAFL